MSHLQPDQTTRHDNSARQKRRGMIEKRRRDRINHSLSELRRLVPAAYEKQGSSKLEKAEILQLTVDYLKFLRAKGVPDYRPSPQPITALTQQHQIDQKQEPLEANSPVQTSVPSSMSPPNQHLSTAQLQLQQQQQQQQQSQQQQPTQLHQQQEQLFAGHHHHQQAHHHQAAHLTHSHLSNAPNYHNQLTGPTSGHFAAAAAAANYNPVQYYYSL